MNNLGFDNEKYLSLQYDEILKRKEGYDKIYIEGGGKIFNDLHASRVLPGFDSNIKAKLLLKLKDQAEIIFCVSANEIEKNKINADIMYSYENETMKIVENLRELGLCVSSIVITLFKGQPNALKFGEKLIEKGEKVYFHNFTKGYPNEIDTIVSDDGYGANQYIETSRPIVFVTSPSPASGKLATCLSQIYHDNKNGINSTFAKYETFPVWNLPLTHPINVAYESATADVKDINMIDPFYFNKYNRLAVSYNKDIAVFPTLANIMKKIKGENTFSSPTEVGINMIADAITDEEIVSLGAKKEIVRRFFKSECEYKKGKYSLDTTVRTKQLMSELDLTPDFINVVPLAKQESKKSGYPCIALELPDGRIIYGKNKKIISASGAVLLNALRTLAEVGDDFSILPDEILMPIIDLRTEKLNYKNGALTIDDILITLSISAQKNKIAKKTLDQLKSLKGCEAHCTYILPSSEEQTLKRLGINITCEPVFLGNKLFR